MVSIKVLNSVWLPLLISQVPIVYVSQMSTFVSTLKIRFHPLTRIEWDQKYKQQVCTGKTIQTVDVCEAATKAMTMTASIEKH